MKLQQFNEFLDRLELKYTYERYSSSMYIYKVEGKKDFHVVMSFNGEDIFTVCDLIPIDVGLNRSLRQTKVCDRIEIVKEVTLEGWEHRLYIKNLPFATMYVDSLVVVVTDGEAKRFLDDILDGKLDCSYLNDLICDSLWPIRAIMGI